MAERPGAEKLGPHGLFSQTDDRIDLDSVAEEVGNHEGPIWTHVVSLHREDAERLGYHNAQAWRDLVRRNVTELAKAHKIDLDNLQWYAAFHNTMHHPHMHLLVYAKDARQGWLSKKGIDNLRSVFGEDIFRFEQQKLFRMETELRDKLKKDFDYELSVNMIEAAKEYEPTPEITLQIQRLRTQLKKQNGKKLYGYLPKEIKTTVDQIVAELAKSEGIAELYKEWNRINREKLSLYREKKEPDLPLEDNPEFRSIKNQIIKAVLDLPLPEDYDPIQENTPKASETDYVSMTYVFNEDRTAAVKVPACVIDALKAVAYALAQMLAERQQQRINRLRGQTDRKLRSKIAQKKAAHGLKTDGQIYRGDEEQSI